MKIKIAILFGGKSAEHEVSLKSATNIFNAVDKTKFEPILLGNDKNGDWYHNIDYVAKNVDLTKLDYFTHASSVFLFNSNDQIPKKLKTTIVSSQIFAKFGTKTKFHEHH